MARGKNFDKPINAWMHDVRDWIREWMINNGRNATGGTSRDLRVVVGKDGITRIVGADQTQWVLKGRKAGGFPPLNELMKWIRVKGILPPDLTLKSFAFLIGRKMAKRGTSPKTPKLRNQQLDLVINQKGRKHLVDLSTMAAVGASTLSVQSLLKAIPNSKVVGR